MCKYDSPTNPAAKTQISGPGRSEVETLVSPFARAADLTMKEALGHVLNDAPIANAQKAASFGGAISREYGDIDTFKVVCAAMAPA